MPGQGSTLRRVRNDGLCGEFFLLLEQAAVWYDLKVVAGMTVTKESKSFANGIEG